MNRDRIKEIVNEELTKANVESMINSKISSTMDSRDFKKAVKELATDVVNNVFRALWQKNNFWRNDAERV